LPMLHQEFGPDYVNRIVMPVFHLEISKAIAHADYYGLYSTRLEEIKREVLTSMTRQSLAQFVVIEDVFISPTLQRQATIPNQFDKS
jgi:hypothetical protein